MPQRKRTALILSLALVGLVAFSNSRAAQSDPAWPDRMLAARAELNQLRGDPAEKTNTLALLKSRLEQNFPAQVDWMLQDSGEDWEDWLVSDDTGEFEQKIIRRALEELGPAGEKWTAELNQLQKGPPHPDPLPVRRGEGGRAGQGSGLELYQKICEQRRQRRLGNILKQSPQIIFTRHYNLGGSHYAYTEGQSDAQNERHFHPGSALCLLKMDGPHGSLRTLLEDPNGVIRDPAVSYDGQRILFAWKKSSRQDDYHLYEMDAKTGGVRQLTSGLGFADYEGCYLPNGDIIFTSTRCVQTVDCWWTEVSNLYTCDRNGQRLRRLAFDQVHDNFPTVLDDGRIIYTRWEYSDRGQIFVQGLFQMNPDGTGQMEFYGNNSWFPTSILHARGIPGTQKVLAIFSGHHTSQAGRLGLLDPAKGRQENSGAQLAAPIRETKAPHTDAYGQSGALFQYPYPLNERECLVGYTPYGWARRPTLFNIYWMDLDGRRELLAADPEISCNQPVPLRPRPTPTVRPSQADFRQTTGTFYVEDVYAGEGLQGVPRGAVKRLRVIALEYRAAGIGWNYNRGPAGDALASTPVSIGNGCWDVKVVLGDAKVYPDGSACFKVPAHTPVYFQALDENGYAVQSMRSWSTLQPGEYFACAGCHESKNATPSLASRPSLALKAGPQSLEPFYGPPRGFSYVKEIQPILDRHCISCHKDSKIPPVFSRTNSAQEVSFSLLGRPVMESISKRNWCESYLALTQTKLGNLESNPYLAGTCTPFLNWIDPQSAPPVLPPYAQGAAKSQFLKLLKDGHKEVKLPREALDKLACWIDLGVPFCGDYTEANAWTDEEKERYDHFLQKRKQMEKIEEQTIHLLAAP